MSKARDLADRSAADLTAVTAGTNIVVTNGAGPIPSIAASSSVATLTDTQTLTNKTITSPVITLATIAQTASYVATISDSYKLVTMDVATANNFDIPANTSVAYAIGTVLNVLQIGAGQTTIRANSSNLTTVFSTGATTAAPKLRARFSAASCIKTATDTWYVIGDIS